MKKVIILLLIILLIILGIVTMVKGIRIGNFEVLSYSSIAEKNQNLDAKIAEASQLTSVTFPEKISTLTSTSKKLVTTREQYQDKVAYSSAEDIKRAKEVKNYQVDFLFTRLGNYVKKHGVDMDLKAVSTSATGEYNLNFVIYGKYVLISEFIRDIENDSQLNFIIENFNLTPYMANETVSSEILKAEFVVSSIRLDVDESIENTNSNIGMNIYENPTTDTTNTNNTNNTNNTTNTNNTNNTTANTITVENSSNIVE